MEAGNFYFEILTCHEVFKSKGFCFFFIKPEQTQTYTLCLQTYIFCLDFQIKAFVQSLIVFYSD